jgi:hypothetical protein
MVPGEAGFGCEVGRTSIRDFGTARRRDRLEFFSGRPDKVAGMIVIQVSW